MNITRKIDCTYRYWNGLTVTIVELDDGSVKVTHPVRKYDGLGGEFPAYRTETVSGPVAELVKKVNNDCRIIAKDDGNSFTVMDVLNGLPFAYGYTVSDF